MINIVAAVSKDGYIANNNSQLPWGDKQKSDLKFFRELTMNHTVIVGRKTFDQLKGGLSGRKNIVVTTKKQPDTKNASFVNIDKAIQIAQDSSDDIFVIGGAQIYQAFLPLTDYIYLSIIDMDVDSGLKFPDFDRQEWKLISEKKYKSDNDNKYDYSFLKFERSI
jgi:dihydrofolate reductase